jgi:competence protein ComEA
VDVAGRVREPGLRTLPPGARVQDALQAAGGPLPGTDLTALNLARPLGDGEEVVVGAVGAAGAVGAPGGAPGGPPQAAPGSPLSLSSATLQQLDALPGVGPVLAQRIIDYREQHGGFQSVDQLRQVSGFGGRRLQDLKALLRP